MDFRLYSISKFRNLVNKELKINALNSNNGWTKDEIWKNFRIYFRYSWLNWLTLKIFVMCNTIEFTKDSWRQRQTRRRGKIHAETWKFALNAAYTQGVWFEIIKKYRASYLGIKKWGKRTNMIAFLGNYSAWQDGVRSTRWRSWLTLTGRQAAILRKTCRTSPSSSNIGILTRSFTRHNRHKSK